MYTTVAIVREAAGLTGNTNISDAMVSRVLRRAENTFNGVVVKRYVLPLPKYYTNSITFSGTGSGTSAMTITINGESFVITMSVGLTASAAADLFRSAALSATSFVVDEMGSGTVVTINSKASGDSTDVAISTTDPQIVSGITATGGTVAEASIPAIEAIVTDLAAARLMIMAYGEEAQGSDKDGFKLYAMVTKELKEIQDGTTGLYDFAGVELPIATTRRLKFYPTTASQTDSANPTANKFTMNQDY